jgi:hypothetical protein
MHVFSVLQLINNRDPSRLPRGTLYPHKLAMTSPTSGGRSVGIVRLRTQTMEFVYFCVIYFLKTMACGLFMYAMISEKIEEYY